MLYSLIHKMSPTVYALCVTTKTALSKYFHLVVFVRSDYDFGALM